MDQVVHVALICCISYLWLISCDLVYLSLARFELALANNQHRRSLYSSFNATGDTECDSSQHDSNYRMVQSDVVHPLFSQFCLPEKEV
jgi:hypothetical protein